MTSFTKKIVLGFGMLLSVAGSKAATFTAVTSGNFSSAATWGGTAPSANITSDIIVIPNGITVTLTSNESFSATSALTVNGTLTSGSNMSALIMTGGTLAGNGTITVDSLALGLTSGLTYTGNITAQKLTSLGFTVSTLANVTVAQTLRVASGTMSLTSGTVTMAANSTIEMAGGSLATSGSGTLNLSNSYNVLYSVAATAGMELAGGGLHNITINAPGNVTLSSNLTANGTLTLTAGSLVLNGRNLIFGPAGDVAASGSGTISSTNTSSIVVNTTGSLTGALRFNSAANTVHNLTVNITNTGSSINLGSDLNLDGQLNLQSGKIILGNSNLNLMSGSTVSGGSSSNYVVTNGMGKLMQNIAASASGTFHVGTAANYAPVTLTDVSGTVNSTISVNVIDTVYANGTSGVVLSNTQPVVKATWFVTSSVTTGLNYTMQANWNASMEVNGFNRTQAYIAHYINGAWDSQTAASATASAGMYSMTRANITSLSPFAVADKDAVMTTGIKTVGGGAASIVVYPNPASAELYFNSSVNVARVDLYDVVGHLVKSVNVANANSVSVKDLSNGIYYAHFVSDNNTVVKQFVKE